MGFASFKHVKVSAIKGVVPEKIINIDDEIQYYGNDKRKLERNKKILGLNTRHVVEDGVTTADLCEVATRFLFNETKINPSEIDALIFSSVTPDYIAPATSFILHGKLDLDEKCTCMDLNGGCTALVHALLTAHSMIESGTVKKVLILSGDIPSRRNDVRNRITSMLLADSGVAILLEYSEKVVPSYFLTGSRGKKWNSLVVPAGGARFPIRKDITDVEVTDESGNVWHLWDDIMKGMDVFNFTMEIGPKSIKDLLEYANMTVDDIDIFAIHQANKQIVETIRRHAGLPAEKVSTKAFEKYANLSSVSCVSALMESLTPQMKKAFMCTFGVGLSWGSCIIDTSDLYNGKMTVLKTPDNIPSREEIAKYWIQYFKEG